MSSRPDARELPAPGRRGRWRPELSPDPDSSVTVAGPAGRWPSDPLTEVRPTGAAADHARPADDRGDPEGVARALCLRALTRAPRTRQELADLLARRGVPGDAAERILDRFAEAGLVDDAAFARAWVTSRQAGRGLARRALEAELRGKGIDGAIAEEAIAQVDEEDERTAARRLVQRRLPGLRRCDRETATRRLRGMLARRGYGAGLAGAVVREELDGRWPDDSSDDDPDGAGLDAFLP